MYTFFEKVDQQRKTQFQLWVLISSLAKAKLDVYFWWSLVSAIYLICQNILQFKTEEVWNRKNTIDDFGLCLNLVFSTKPLICKIIQIKYSYQDSIGI